MQYKVFLYYLCLITGILYAHQGITSEVACFSGDTIIPFSFAFMLSKKYNIPLYLNGENEWHKNLKPFRIYHSDLPTWNNDNLKKWKLIPIQTEKDIQQHIHEDNIMFITSLRTSYNFSQQHYQFLREALEINRPIVYQQPPSDRISIVMHVRKAIQGIAPWFGALASQQYYNIKAHTIHYVKNHYHPLTYLPRICQKEATDCQPVNYKNFTYFDKVHDWETKYPPEQYYAEALKEVSARLNNQPLFVRIITDDNKNPLKLVERIKKAVNLKNIDFHYQDLRHLNKEDCIRSELYALSQHDIYIRSQSYFSRIAEIIGSHTLVYSPIAFKWQNNSTLIMTQIGVTGSYKKLLKKENS
ncbi:TPA: hypothetical protein DIC20_03875 [Candidatus Dependentiae bacterium]|nr:MAG: hypothetical protein US03_C0001G0162 [candidate division TM6 bacterium GW2011_GWF2_36_131]KKQ03702.1 MAG: hypothetical protein US13_C0001G0042 [candidate division TM6 bacterium GW2011_GWE2_36_25]KKQ20062.1 MAG: hypothetical protein US32_C0002G0067 [candidate division TM6 bacterium GW2011_GWA2_36_9]HBR70469.1 hypothetical protein [Candidatus Dependentiae bacterium]HCU00815.1 hypothetical protein [Candidatus Dependentiae bacterium]